MHKIIFIPVIIFFLSIGHTAIGQIDHPEVGLQIHISLGNPVTGIGISIIARGHVKKIVQPLIGGTFTYYFRNYGPCQSHHEWSIIAGLHHLWGDSTTFDIKPGYIKYLDDRSYQYSFGYTWERFINPIGTSQNVGSFTCRYKNIVFMASNDAFANFEGEDRFRTGAFGIGYLTNDEFFYAKTLIWTGDTRCPGVKRYRDTDYPARWGYRDITPCKYGKYSHGILSLGYMHMMDFGQSLGIEIGGDSENIRNVIQNKVFHDLYFIPSFMNKAKNLHLPMKTKDGANYLYQKDKQIKPPEMVWQILANGSMGW